MAPKSFLFGASFFVHLCELQIVTPLHTFYKGESLYAIVETGVRFVRDRWNRLFLYPDFHAPLFGRLYTKITIGSFLLEGVEPMVICLISSCGGLCP